MTVLKLEYRVIFFNKLLKLSKMEVDYKKMKF